MSIINLKAWKTEKFIIVTVVGKKVLRAPSKIRSTTHGALVWYQFKIE